MLLSPLHTQKKKPETQRVWCLAEDPLVELRFEPSLSTLFFLTFYFQKGILRSYSAP